MCAQSCCEQRGPRCEVMRGPQWTLRNVHTVPAHTEYESLALITARYHGRCELGRSLPAPGYDSTETPTLLT